MATSAGWRLVTFTVMGAPAFRPSKWSMDRSKSITSVEYASTATMQTALLTPLLTVIVACPGATAVTLPNSSTTATSGSLEVRVMAAPASELSTTLSSKVLPGCSSAEVWDSRISPGWAMSATLTAYVRSLAP